MIKKITNYQMMHFSIEQFLHAPERSAMMELLHAAESDHSLSY
jgi:hypothetical protein